MQVAYIEQQNQGRDVYEALSMYQLCPLVPPSAVIYTVHFQKKIVTAFNSL